MKKMIKIITIVIIKILEKIIVIIIKKIKIFEKKWQ